MKFRCFFLFALIFSFFISRNGYAEFVCGAEVSYKWTYQERPEPAPTGIAPHAQPVPAPTFPPPVVSVVRFGSAERSGADEAAAQAALEKEVARLKVRASEACQREHEGFGACVSTKLAANAPVLSALDFSARKELQKALTDDCQLQVGKCSEIVSSEPVCREIVTAQPTPAASEEKGKGKKK